MHYSLVRNKRGILGSFLFFVLVKPFIIII
nr:MAG TPA: hypothetical protein [Caudoviricetes sp.]